MLFGVQWSTVRQGGYIFSTGALGLKQPYHCYTSSVSAPQLHNIVHADREKPPTCNTQVGSPTLNKVCC